MENIEPRVRRAFMRAYKVKPEKKPQWFDEFVKYYCDNERIQKEERSEEENNFE